MFYQCFLLSSEVRCKTTENEIRVIAQIAGPIGKAGNAGARDRADELAREVAALAITLHTSLIKSAVRDVLDR